MVKLRQPLALVVGLVFGAIPLPSLAQLYVNIGAPPLLPSYEQPPLSTPNQIWTPGYWAWGPAGYYWVPGTWAQPPSAGLMYTPGYWNAADNGYNWNQGYWAPNVGYYGGVNYGSGYYGNGYAGGAWSGNVFRYNTAVTRVNPTVIRNVYVNHTVIVKNVNHVSYYGGHGGLTVRPTPAQLAVARERHVPLTTAQRQHIAESAQDRNLLVNVNHGKPPVTAVARPLNATNQPADFKPVTAADRQKVQAKAAVKPAGSAQQAAKPAAKPAQPAAKPAQPAKPAAKPAQPAAKPAQPVKPAAKPAPKPAAKPPAHAVSKPQAKPAGQPAKPAGQPAKPAGQPAKPPAKTK